VKLIEKKAAEGGALRERLEAKLRA
jgi:hypothetical protein